MAYSYAKTYPSGQKVVSEAVGHYKFSLVREFLFKLQFDVISAKHSMLKVFNRIMKLLQRILECIKLGLITA